MALAHASTWYSSDLQEYAVSDQHFLEQHKEFDVLCTGVVVFDKDGRLLLVQRAAEELAFANCWEIPGGKVDDTDSTILAGAARELYEEAGLIASRIIRKVGEFTFHDDRPGRKPVTWLKIVFEVEVENIGQIKLDPVEHQNYLWATQEELENDLVGDTHLTYVSAQNKCMKLEAFKLWKEAKAMSFSILS